MQVCCVGAGGFIGGHLVARLLKDGHVVRAIDVKPTTEWWQLHPKARNYRADLSEREACEKAAAGCDWVINLAASMGGMGMIQTCQVETGMNVLISTRMLDAAVAEGAEHYLYASSACIYPDYRQDSPDVPALKEADAWPAAPQDMYGLEKLFSEELALRVHRESGLQVRLPRFHAIYGPHGSWTGGREKAPAALCRKVATSVLRGDYSIKIWGDGEQTRSFCYVDDCVEGVMRLMASDVNEPINLGSSELVTINELVTLLEEIASVELERSYDLTAPQGVRGRNSDNTMIQERLDWQPSIPLRFGLEATYRWVYDQARQNFDR